MRPPPHVVTSWTPFYFQRDGGFHLVRSQEVSHETPSFNRAGSTSRGVSDGEVVLGCSGKRGERSQIRLPPPLRK